MYRHFPRGSCASSSDEPSPFDGRGGDSSDIWAVEPEGGGIPSPRDCAYNPDDGLFSFFFAARDN